jgi:RNA polymerase sigma factor (sigma-70 family)
MQPAVRDVMLAAIPTVRAVAMSLCRNPDRADDLVQETLVRAIANINSFEAGTNMEGWLITILRNQFRSEWRWRRHEVEDEVRRRCPGVTCFTTVTHTPSGAPGIWTGAAADRGRAGTASI